MRFTKAKIVAAGMILAGICMIAPQQLRAEVPQEQMDGVMGQSIKEEMDDTQISDVDTQRDGLLSTYAMPRLLGASKASSGYTQDFSGWFFYFESGLYKCYLLSQIGL